MHLNERKLIQGLKEGNADARKSLIDRFSSPLYGLIKRMIEDDKIAAEILKKSF